MKKILIFLLGILMLSSLVFAAISTSAIISISLVNQDPDPVVAGDVVEVRIGIENEGGADAENLIVEIVPEYPFSAVSGSDLKREIGTVQSYQTDDDMQIVKFKLQVSKDAKAGEHELKIKYYEEGSESQVQKSVYIDVRNSDNAEVVYIDKSSILPGKETEISFTINNVGNTELKDLTFKWENEDEIILPVGSDNTKHISSIPIGDSYEIKYNVVADSDADPGLYKLDLSLTYNDAITGTTDEISTIAGIYVGGGTDFEIAFSESSDEATSFTIANIGSNPAYSVSVIIPEQQGWSVSGSNSMIIGNLNKGDYTVASFALTSGGTMGTGAMPEMEEGLTREEMMEKMQNQRETMNTTQSSNNKVKIEVAYTDTKGERKTVEKEVTVNSESSTTGTSAMAAGGNMNFGARGGMQQENYFSKYKWYIVVLVVVIIGAVLNGRYKKEKLKNPDYKFMDLFKKKKKITKKQ